MRIEKILLRLLVNRKGTFMDKTILDRKVKFKVMRNALGLAVSNAAYMFNTSDRTVRAWESVTSKRVVPVPDDAFELLENCYKEHLERIQCSVNKIHEIEEKAGKKPTYVDLAYYYSQPLYRHYHRHDNGYYKIANANTLAVAAILELEGYTVNIMRAEEYYKKYTVSEFE